MTKPSQKNLPRHRWQDMTTVDFATADTSRWIAVLPVCAIEQHGPHLPVATDTAIGEGLIAAMLRKLPVDLPVAVLPTQAIGKSNEHIHSPGTLTLSFETLARVLIDIGESVARAGVKKLVLANSHGGNIAVNDIVARELRIKHDMLCVSASWARLGMPAGLFTEFESQYGIHGGEMETSVMLALAPDLVKMTEAKKFHSIQEGLVASGQYLRAHGPNAFGWIAQDLNREGAVGDAALATAEKGQKAIDAMTDKFIALLQEMDAFDLRQLWKKSDI
jgi:creatinine amidohydrolase